MDIYLAVVVLYVVVLLGVGLYKMRQVKSQDDFMVAGRKTTTFYLVMTLVCTWIGSGSLFGGAGLAFRTGFSELWWSAGGWAGIVVVYFIAHRVRRISQYTLSDLLEQRYNKYARILGSSAVVLAYMTIAGYQFRGGGRLLNILTGVDPIIGGLIVCGVVILFTMAAGMVSIISIDFFNGLIMTGGVLIAVPLTLSAIGGWEQVATLPAERFTAFGEYNGVWAMGVFLPTLLLLLSESSMYQKFFSAKDESSARKAVVGMVIGVVIIETALATLSVIGSSKYNGIAPFYGADGMVDTATSETIILHLARFDLPTFAGILLLCAGVAIILSTANTFLMVSSTNITRDFYQRFFRDQHATGSLVLFQRVAVLIIGLLAYAGANFFPSIMDMAFTAYAMVGAGITPALLAAFLWKRVTVAGGVASIATGMGVTVLITVLNVVLESPLMETDYIILPAAGASITALFAVSLLTPASPEEKWKPFMTNGK